MISKMKRKYYSIKNSSAYGTIPTEYLLNIGRRPQTSKKASQSTQNEVGQKIKIKKNYRFQDGDLHPRKGVMKEEKFPHTHAQGQGGALEPWKGMPLQVPGRQNGEKPPQRSLFNSTSQPRKSLHSRACLREWGLGTEAQACGVGPQGEYWV